MADEAEARSSLFRDLLPAAVLVAEMNPLHANPEALYSQERAFVASAVHRRRQEFAAGRILARGLLRTLDFDGPLLRAHDGPPLWPPGIVGSITHCATLAAAAVCVENVCSGVGIDVEIRRPLLPEVAELVLTEEERWIGSQNGDAEAALLVFCAKEALYKAIYPLTRQFMEFDALAIAPTNNTNTFTAQLRAEARPFRSGHIFEGRWSFTQDHVGAAVVIGPASRPV